MINFLFLAVSQVEANQASLTSNLSNLGVTLLAAIGVAAVLRARKQASAKGQKPAAVKKAESVAAPKAEPVKVAAETQQNGQQAGTAENNGASARQKTFRKAPEVSVAKKAPAAQSKTAEAPVAVAETPVVVSSGRRYPGANMSSYLQMAKEVNRG